MTRYLALYLPYFIHSFIQHFNNSIKQHTIFLHALNHLYVVRNIRLIKQAKNLLQAFVNPSMQQRNLHNDAIMLLTLYKRIRNSILLMLFLQHILLVIILQCKITAKVQSLSWQPYLLKFNQHQVRLIVFIQDSGMKSSRASPKLHLNS